MHTLSPKDRDTLVSRHSALLLLLPSSHLPQLKMLKAARLLLARTREPIISGNSSLLGASRNASIFRNFITSSGTGNSSKYFSDLSIFKSEGALILTPITPKFTEKEYGVHFLDKSGSVMLKFVPACGIQQYDWPKRKAFALTPTEVGCLIGLDLGESCEFVHDPSMKSSLEGQVQKILSVKSIIHEDAAYCISLTVSSAVLDTTEHFSVPVSKAEFAVMRTAFSFVLPHIIGWDRLVAQLSETSRFISPSRNITELSPDAEWSR